MIHKISAIKFQLSNFKLQLAILSFLTMTHCSTPEKPLPIFKNLDETTIHYIADFEFLNQDSLVVTQETFKDKIYVADFFFTTCRTICPLMKSQMVRVNDAIQDMPDVLIVSHSIDPEYDTVGLLHDYAERLGAKSNKWYFLTGKSKEYVFDLAQESYFSSALEDKSEPDGFIHSGAFLLIDKERRIRGKYDGTLEEDVNRLIEDIKKLRKEYEK